MNRHLVKRGAIARTLFDLQTRNYSSKNIKHVTSIADLNNRQTIQSIIDKSIDIKQHPNKYKECMSRQGILMLFQNQSLRTQVSFEAGAYQLGGHAINAPSGIFENQKTNFADVAKMVSRFVKCIVARLATDEDLQILREHSTVPVINGGSPSAHPCQTLSDVMTIQERKVPVTKTMEDVTVAFVGEPNPQLYDLIRVSTLMRMPLRISVPDLNNIDKSINVDKSVINFYEDPREALTGADVIYSDFSKESTDPRFAMTKELITNAKPDVIFMSRFPIDRDPTSNKDLIDDKNSVIYEQALNRLYIQKALLVYLLAPHFFEK